jgi:hypothetical protein
MQSKAPAHRPPINTALVTLRAGPVRLGAKTRISNGGLLAIGGLVSSILLSTAAVVWVSTSVARQHPLAAGWLRRR